MPLADIDGELFQLPETITDTLYQKIPQLDINELTSRVVNGPGVFDGLMASVKAHLRAEYDANRITGQEYTKAYIEITQSAMQFAVQFLLGRDGAFWQAQTAQIQAITGRINMEKARYDYLAAKYAYDNIQPAQLTLIKEQAEVQHAQTSDSRLDGPTVVGLIGRQKALYSQQIISYQRDAEVKAGKLFTDAWGVQKTIDEGLTAPTGFTNASVDDVLTAIKTNNGF